MGWLWFSLRFVFDPGLGFDLCERPVDGVSSNLGREPHLYCKFDRPLSSLSATA